MGKPIGQGQREGPGPGGPGPLLWAWPGAYSCSFWSRATSISLALWAAVRLFSRMPPKKSTSSWSPSCSASLDVGLQGLDVVGRMVEHGDEVVVLVLGLPGLFGHLPSRGWVAWPTPYPNPAAPQTRRVPEPEGSLTPYFGGLPHGEVRRTSLPPRTPVNKGQEKCRSAPGAVLAHPSRGTPRQKRTAKRRAKRTGY